VIIPEEVEILLPIVRSAQDSPTSLLAYAAPVTRRMLHFGGLKFYSVPALPQPWEAPMWLKLELGIFAGRLYFDFSEYSAMLDFLGIRHTGGRLEISDEAEDDSDDASMSAAPEAGKVFTRRPLTFLQEWLAIRRNGQNFDQTPMGFVCQGRVLDSSHHFFAELDILATTMNEGGKTTVATSGEIQEAEDVEEEFHEEDHGDIVRPEDLQEDFDVSKLNTGELVLGNDTDEDD
jgi:hypothetical protein